MVFGWIGSIVFKDGEVAGMSWGPPEPEILWLDVTPQLARSDYNALQGATDEKTLPPFAALLQLSSLGT